MKFSERLISLRKRRGWSQEDLAEQLDVSRQTVSKWENGESTPELSKLIKMSKIFNMSLDELVDEESEAGNDDEGTVEIKDIKEKQDSKEIEEEQNFQEIKESEVIEDTVDKENSIEILGVVEYKENDKNNVSIQITERPITRKELILNKMLIKVATFFKKNYKKLIAVTVVSMLILYGITFSYRYFLYDRLRDKIEYYRYADNFYLEKSSTIMKNDKFMRASKAHCWYKNGVLKTEYQDMESELVELTTYMDFNNKFFYMVTKDGTAIKIDGVMEDYASIKQQGVLDFLIGNYYVKDNKKILLDSLRIFLNKIYTRNGRIQIDFGKEITSTLMFDWETGIIKEARIFDMYGEEDFISHRLILNSVEDEDVDYSEYIKE